jgi:hypothetical protein
MGGKELLDLICETIFSVERRGSWHIVITTGWIQVE